MIKMLLSGWFIIQSASYGGEKHNYLVFDPIKNYSIAVTSDRPFPYEEGSWIKLKMDVDCNLVIYQPNSGVRQFVGQHICTANTVEILECTKYNSVKVNGLYYC